MGAAPQPAAVPPTINSSATPPNIVAGQSTVLQWMADNAIAVTIDNGIGNQPASGKVTVSPAATTTYHLTASAASGATAMTAVTVTVTAAPPPPPAAPTVQFTAGMTTIVSGQSTQLNWSTTNATSFAIDNGVNTQGQVAMGSATVSPTVTTTYTATATGAGGTVTAAATITVTPAAAGVAVLTHHNDLARDGANLNEVMLTPASVNATSFGKKYSYPVDGQIYTQPLYVPGLMINGSAHNVVFVATNNDTVYAFDAEGGGTLWQMSMGTAVPNNDPQGVQPILGILSTPVIDASTGTMYLTAITTGRVYKLHALDITTGLDKAPAVVLSPSVQGTGKDSVNGTITLDHGCYQRTGLALANNRIYIGFTHCNHGWLVAYDPATLAQMEVFNTTPDGIGAAVFSSGAAPTVDSAGDVYIITSVDIGGSPRVGRDYPDSFLRLSPDLQVQDSFTPSNEVFLQQNDGDLGSGAPILMPDNGSATPHEIIGGGKDGRVFVINRDPGKMGGYNPPPNAADNVIQKIQTGTHQFDNIWGLPAFWNGTLYYHTEDDVLKAYSWNAAGDGMLSSGPVAKGKANFKQHGASPSISANGTSNGIVWEIDDTGYDPAGGAPAVLHATDASNVANELYNSNQAPNGRDVAGKACKFSIPTIADGKVFVPTSNELDIYGLLP